MLKNYFAPSSRSDDAIVSKTLARTLIFKHNPPSPSNRPFPVFHASSRNQYAPLAYFKFKLLEICPFNDAFSGSEIDIASSLPSRSAMAGGRSFCASLFDRQITGHRGERTFRATRLKPGSTFRCHPINMIAYVTRYYDSPPIRNVVSLPFPPELCLPRMSMLHVTSCSDVSAFRP